MESKKVYNSSAFHLWPFGKRSLWRGFMERNIVTIENGKIEIRSGKHVKEFKIGDLDFFIKKNRWFKGGNPKIILGIAHLEKGFWKGGNVDFDYFYVDKNDYDEFHKEIKSFDPVCYSKDSLMLESKPHFWNLQWWNVNGNRESLWINPLTIISSADIENGWCILTSEISYFYVKGVFSKDLIIGSEKELVFKNVSKEETGQAYEFIHCNGGHISELPRVTYTDRWTLDVIWSPALWFSSSSIGLGENVIIYKQKTFKTIHSVSLPYSEVYMAIFRKKWNWFFSRGIAIFGAQNILPKNRYSKKAVQQIDDFFQEKHIPIVRGNLYRPSFHTSWFGLFLNTITLNLYHWIMTASRNYAKRPILAVGKERLAWNGELFVADFHSIKVTTMKIKEPSYVIPLKEVEGAVYIKTHKWNLWGFLFIWIKDSSNDRKNTYCDIEVHKVWGHVAKSIIKKIESRRGQFDTNFLTQLQKWGEMRVNEIK